MKPVRAMERQLASEAAEQEAEKVALLAKREVEAEAMRGRMAERKAATEALKNNGHDLVDVFGEDTGLIDSFLDHMDQLPKQGDITKRAGTTFTIQTELSPHKPPGSVEQKSILRKFLSSLISEPGATAETHQVVGYCVGSTTDAQYAIFACTDKRVRTTRIVDSLIEYDLEGVPQVDFEPAMETPKYKIFHIEAQDSVIQYKGEVTIGGGRVPAHDFKKYLGNEMIATELQTVLSEIARNDQAIATQSLHYLA